jgi:hypothetical protein
MSTTLTPNPPSNLPAATQANATDVIAVDQLQTDGSHATKGLTAGALADLLAASVVPVPGPQGVEGPPGALPAPGQGLLLDGNLLSVVVGSGLELNDGLVSLTSDISAGAAAGANAVPKTAVNAASGVAGLDASSLLAGAQLPLDGVTLKLVGGKATVAAIDNATVLVAGEPLPIGALANSLAITGAPSVVYAGPAGAEGAATFQLLTGAHIESAVDGTSLAVASGKIALGDASAGTVLCGGPVDAGYVPLSLQSRFGQIPNVRDQGALADESTDNTVPFINIQTNAGTAKQGAYIVPPGSYVVNQALPPTNTGPMAMLLGCQLMGSGYVPGNTDGSALGGSGLNAMGIGFVRPMGDPYNQSVLVVQGIAVSQSGTTSYQKNGIYVNVVTQDISDFPSYTKDFVAVTGFGNIAAGNTQGRAWGANFIAATLGNGDGLLTGVEIDIQNNSVYQPALSQPNSKNGLGIFSLGTQPGTSAMTIGANFHYGIIFNAPTATTEYVWAIAAASGFPASCDPLGNIVGLSLKSGTLTITAAPTTSAGLSAGEVWSNNGVLTLAA